MKGILPLAYESTKTAYSSKLIFSCLLQFLWDLGQVSLMTVDEGHQSLPWMTKLTTVKDMPSSVSHVVGIHPLDLLYVLKGSGLLLPCLHLAPNCLMDLR